MKRIGLESKIAAQKMEKKLVIEVEKKVMDRGGFSWKKVIELYFVHLENEPISKKTIDNYRLCLEAHTLAEWGTRPIASISAIEIKNLINVKLVNRSESHRKNLLKYIRGVFNFAVESNFIPRNPSPKMKFRIGDKVMGILTEAQARAFLAKAKEYDSEWFPIWATAIYTGMRNGELYALTWDQVNLESRQIKVISSWNSSDGFKDTKSGDQRNVEMALELVEIFKEIKIKFPESNFVLPRIDKWDKGEQAREVRAFLMAIGLPRIRFHDLRATCATILLSKGVPLLQVQIMLGWRDIKTMMRYVRKAGVDITGISGHLQFHLDTSIS